MTMRRSFQKHRIELAWRGPVYFVYREEIVIVDPHTRRIVAVLVV